MEAAAAGAEMPRLLIVHGGEPLLIDQRVAAWRVAAERLAQVQVCRAPATLREAADALGAQSLFETEQMMLLVDPLQVSERASRAAGSPDELAQLVVANSRWGHICVQIHRLLPLTHPLIARGMEAGGTIAAYAQLRPGEVRGWLVTRLRERGVRLDEAGVAHLLACCGRDLSLLDHEVSKLRVYGRGGPVAGEAVRRLVGGGELVAVWDVIDRLLEPRHGRGAAAIAQLLEEGGSSPVSLITLLSAQVSDLLLVRQMARAGHGSPDEVGSELGLPRWRAERLCRQAERATSGQLAVWLSSLQELDARLKDGQINGADGLRSVGLRMAASFSGRHL